MIAANKHVLLTAMGAFMKLEGGNIMLHGPGTVEFKASMKELAGAASSSAVLPLMPMAEDAEVERGDQYFILKSHDGKPIKNRRYRALTGNQTIEGFTGDYGRSQILDGYLGQIARFELIDESHNEHFILKDSLGKPIADMRYKIKSGDGVEIEGVTDDGGRTGLFTSDKIEKIDLYYVESLFPEDQGVG